MAPKRSQNRRASEAAKLREESALVRARTELAHARAEASLVESLVGPYGGFGMGAWANPFDGGRIDDVGRAWFPLGNGTLFARHQGRNRPFSWTDFDLDQIRSLARWLAAKNPFAIGALKSYRNFVVKKGYTWEARPAKEYAKSETARALAARVQKLIDRYSDLNKLPSRERSAAWRAARDGDAITRHFAQYDGVNHGMTLVRWVEPEQLRDPPDWDQDVAFGVETAPGDVEDVVAYHVTYDGSHYDRIDAADVCHLKRNVDECVKRGISDLFAPGDGFEGVAKLVRNMTVAGGVQAAIAWIEQYESVTSSQVSSSIAGIKDLNRPTITHPVTGRDINTQRFEPGTVVKTGAGKTYTPAPLAGNTTQHTAIAQAALRQAGCTWNMPEYMISGDSSGANFAGTLVAGSPFVNAIECDQADFGLFFLRWRWIAVRNACEAGLLGPYTFEQIQELVDIHYTPPQVAVAKEAEQATIDHQDIAAGVMSLQTRRARRGLDDDQERENLKEEPPTRLASRAQDVDAQGNPAGGYGRGGLGGIEGRAANGPAAAPPGSKDGEKAKNPYSAALLGESAEFDPAKHPRADDGKFGSGGGSTKGEGESNQATELIRKRVKDSRTLTPAEHREVAAHVMRSKTSRKRLARVSSVNAKHSTGDVIDLDQSASFTGRVDDLLAGKAFGHIGWKSTDKAVYVVDSPSRGLDVDYRSVGNVGFDPSGEQETLLAGRYRVKEVKRVAEPGTLPQYGYEVPLYVLEEIPERVSESKDASGHEHDEKGLFTSGGGGGAKGEGESGSGESAEARAAALLARRKAEREAKAAEEAAREAKKAARKQMRASVRAVAAEAFGREMEADGDEIHFAGHGRDISLETRPRDNSVFVQFTQNSAPEPSAKQADKTGWGTVNQSLQSGTVELLHRFQDFVRRLGEKGIGVEYETTEPRRARLYARVLSSSGFTQVSDGVWRPTAKLPESKDASGHEHDEKGLFTSGSGGSASEGDAPAGSRRDAHEKAKAEHAKRAVGREKRRAGLEARRQALAAIDAAAPPKNAAETFAGSLANMTAETPAQQVTGAAWGAMSMAKAFARYASSAAEKIEAAGGDHGKLKAVAARHAERLGKRAERVQTALAKADSLRAEYAEAGAALAELEKSEPKEPAADAPPAEHEAYERAGEKYDAARERLAARAERAESRLAAAIDAAADAASEVATAYDRATEEFADTLFDEHARLSGLADADEEALSGEEDADPEPEEEDEGEDDE